MQFIIINHPTSLSDRLEGDDDEPDLPLLSTLDFSALKDVRETGVEYCRSFEQLLHQTPGLQPGYLPAQDAQYLLSGVSISWSFFVAEFSKPFLTNFSSLFIVSLFQSMHLLTLASYLEERAAKLRREALGRMQVALAGSGSNSMYSTIDSFFGYQTEADTETSTPVEAPDALLSQTTHEPEAAVTKATIFKPGPLERTWTRTGLSKEFLPTNQGGGSYSCPMCPQYQPRSNLDTVATHIRRDHLNISLGCYFCSESFFSSEGWKRHNSQRHGKSKNEYVPVRSRLDSFQKFGHRAGAPARSRQARTSLDAFQERGYRAGEPARSRPSNDCFKLILRAMQVK